MVKQLKYVWLTTAFYQNKEEEGRPMMVKRKLDGAVDKSSAD